MQIEYVNMTYLLLESLHIYGNLNTDTEILIYTSTKFMNIIKQSHLYNSKKIFFEINDTYDTLDKACKARLDLFNFSSTQKYSKILYLDTDILIKDDISKVFDGCIEDLLYVLEERGDIRNDSNDFWGGKTLFSPDELHALEDKAGFTSGILLFKNCEKIKFLFEKINEDIVARSHICMFHDQPFIVYNAYKYKLYNKQLLSSLAVNNNHDIHNNTIIHHFPGGPGCHHHKLIFMKNFLDSLKDFTINAHIDNAKKYINQYLMPIIIESRELLEGNIFMQHHTTNYTDAFLNKTKNISNLVLNKNITKVMEIGFNSGFSTLLMLLSNPKLSITCFDLGEHKYTLPCYYKLKETFGERINIVIGDSTKTLPLVNEKFDLIHIDGGHSTEVATSDIIHSYRLSNQGTILILDDYDFFNLHQLWDIYIKKYHLMPLHIQTYVSPHHDIKYVNF
jgi:predicted O-methyltransferase YrrM